MKFGDKIYLETSTGFKKAHVYKINFDSIDVVWWSYLVFASSKRVQAIDTQLVKRGNFFDKIILSIRINLFSLIASILAFVFIYNRYATIEHVSK